MRDPERFRLERKGIEELSRSAEWLVGTDWHLDGELYLDAIIRAHGHDYEVRVSFPALYPDTPAVVRPRNMEQRVSTHQYGGADGPLCLEWGPDNWHRDVTAVQMLESTHRLFETESPLGENPREIPIVVPSRHSLTVGQEVRHKWARWYANRALANYLAAQHRHSIGRFKFSLRKKGETWIALVHEAMPFGGSVWRDNQIPTDLPGTSAEHLNVGVWFKTDIDGSTIGQPCKVAELQALLAGMEGQKFITTDGTSSVEDFQPRIDGFLIMDRAEELHLFVALSEGDILTFSKVRSENTPVQSRSPESGKLNGKTIGIVGLGSAGSKIAMSLARMGVQNFYLVDHDILLPENLHRHALDWDGVVQHKVDAMTLAIHRIAPGVQVDVCRLHLIGQESNAAVNGALDRLATCDLIIDATANPGVFNLLAVVARTASRPMVWMEVFGGGMGGFVARSRPGIDPTPQDMRSAYLQYCNDNPAPTLQSAAENYAAEIEDDEVLVASDADVAIIAHNAARFVPDCFIPPEQSRFPYSMYLIGLAKGWVFEAPFATIPISMESYTVGGWGEDNQTDFRPEDLEFLHRLLKKD